MSATAGGTAFNFSTLWEHFKKDMPFKFKAWTSIPATAAGAQRDAMLVGSCSSVEFSNDPQQNYVRHQ